MVINPGQMHTGQAIGAQGCAYRMVYPPSSILESLVEETGVRPHGVPIFRHSGLQGPPLADLIPSLHRASEDPGTLALECEGRLLDALARLIELHACGFVARRDGLRHHPVERAVEYLEGHCAESVSLAQIASLGSLSPYYMLRTFRNAVGVPPHVFQIQLRVKSAKELLLRGLPPAQVAVETGFADQSHLTRWFQRMVGVTPGQYRRSRAAARHRLQYDTPDTAGNLEPLPRETETCESSRRWNC